MSELWIDGELLNQSDSLSAKMLFGRDVLLGNGVFETLAMMDDRVMAESHHYERLADACKQTGIKLPEKSLFSKALSDLSQANQSMQRARIRVSVYPQHMIAIIQEAAGFIDPLKLKTLPYRRNRQGALTGVKSTSYGENMQALAWAQQQGGNEGVFLDSFAYVCECTTSNLFWIKQDTLFTPSLETGCLPGVGRRVVLETAEREGVDVEECEMGLSEAQVADVVFLSSSLRGMQLVQQWDEERYELENPRFLRLSERFWQIYAELD